MATKKVDFVVREKGASKAAGGFKKVDGAMASAAKSAAMYAAAYIGVRGIINLTKNAIEAFGIQEDAEKKLATALGKTSQALLDNASALQKVSNFGDEAIIGVQAAIGAFIKNEDAIAKATAATLDFATAQGMDLKGAGDLVAKTLGSTTNALTRYGIEVTGAVGSTERLQSVTDGIARVWGGQAAAAAETMAGKMNQAKMAAGDLAEVIGAALSGTVIDLASELTTATEGLISFFGAITEQKQKKRIEELGSEILRLNDIYKALGDTDVWDGGIKEGIWDALVAAVREYKELTGQILPETELWENAVRKLGTAFEEIPLFDPIQLKETERNLVDFSSIVSASLENAFDPDMEKGDALKQFVIQFLSLMQGVILASEAVSTALTFAFVPGVGIAAAIASLAALEGAKALVRNVEFAATGADFTTSGPQLMMVGEAGREHVSVTPLEGPNINGPQGGNTFIFNGDIIGTDDYIENNLIPAVNLAITQGRAALA
jgi:hypothetical protein